MFRRIFIIVFLILNLALSCYAANTGAKYPTATGEIYNDWTNPTNAYSDNNTDTSTSTNGDVQDYYTFTLGVPDTVASIDGIVVKIEAYDVLVDGTGQVYANLSWNDGVTFTGSLTTGTLTNKRVVYTLGGATNTWGRTWSASEFSDANFKAAISSGIQSTLCSIFVDYITVDVYYTLPSGQVMTTTIIF